MASSPYSAKDETKLMTDLWSPDIADSPYRFVMYAFPWGKKGTPLAGHKGPRKWQIEEMLRIEEHIKMNRARVAKGEVPIVYKSATASGRGVGKSALVAWLNIWFQSCVLGSSAVTTANTGDQLKTKTWAELAKWHTLSINSHWFERTTLGLVPQQWFLDQVEKTFGISSGYYYAKAMVWQEENTGSFAGLHNPHGVLLLFDEASGIPAAIWEVAEGFFTDIALHRYWFCFSNPRQNTGTFYECFHKNRDYWFRRNLDSRAVEGSDIAYLNGIVERYGEHSDAARVEVKGEFPSQGDNQFIARDSVEEAAERETLPDHHAGLIMGVDVARFGDDTTVIWFRRGRDARSIPAIKLKGKDNMQVANECAFWIDEHRPDAVCVDAGNGTGVIDRLREMGYKVKEVWFGAKAGQEEWADTRTELWAEMREWLKGGCIPNDSDLKADLVGPEYGFDKLERIKLESKEKMKKRGVHSPDSGDALAVTFATKVARSDIRASKKSGGGGNKKAHGIDFDVFS